jgi:hypothetical protein
MTRERKWLFSVLALGMLALGADRMFFGISGPSGAGAAEDRGAVAPSPRAPSGKSNQSGAGSSEVPAIDQRTLEMLERHDPSIAWNPFVAPEAWDVVGAAAASDQPQPDPMLELARGPLPTLTAVMATSAGRRAILDGQPFAEGDSVGAWTIRSISERSVELAQGDARVMVELGEPQLTGRGTVGVAGHDRR